ncbi:putative ankyrin-repeat protein [Saitoella coloradoensis]
MSASIHKAAVEGDQRVVASCLAEDPLSLNGKDEVRWCVRRLLICLSQSILTALFGALGRTPLHWACSHGHVAVVDLLLEQKDVDLNIADGAGWYFQLTSLHGNTSNFANRTPLMIAVSAGQDEIAKKLLQNPEVDVNIQSHGGQTALHYAVSKKRLDLVSLLLSHQPPANVKTKDKAGQTPLIRAAAIGSVFLINLLLEHKAPLQASDNHNMTPLHHACAEGHGEAAIELLKRGAWPDRTDKDGCTPLESCEDPKVRDWIKNEAKKEGLKL